MTDPNPDKQHDPKRKECPRHGWYENPDAKAGSGFKYIKPAWPGNFDQLLDYSDTQPDCTCKPDKPLTDERPSTIDEIRDYLDDCDFSNEELAGHIHRLVRKLEATIDALKRKIEAAKNRINELEAEQTDGWQKEVEGIQYWRDAYGDKCDQRAKDLAENTALKARVRCIALADTLIDALWEKCELYFDLTGAEYKGGTPHQFLVTRVAGWKQVLKELESRSTDT